MKRYNPIEIEPKWQARWEADKIYQASEDPNKPKKYILEYFPYPSGAAMHVGHVRNYTIGDALARFARMNGHNVLHPMGWDAFGLPAENYAIKTGISPREAIDQNTKRFKEQLMQMGFSYDWSREIDSTDPKYYKWTQWFFLLLFKKGLAYQQESLQWWCPFDKTVLANEQVESGRCWRCGHEVEKKSLKQWFFKITDYADRLEKDLDDVNWSESIKSMQRNWIGRSKGAEITFALDQKSSYVLLHGYSGSSKQCFFPWLSAKLGENNTKVQMPDLPNSDNPTVMEQVAFVKDTCSFDANTVLLGHSLGAVVALKTVEALDTPIKKLVLVAGFTKPNFLDHPRPFEQSFNWEFDFEKIKKNVKEIVVLQALNDTVVPPELALELQDKLDAKLVKFTAQEDHICGTKEPVVLENVLTAIKVFTTRPDTLFGATFMVLAPEHPLVQMITTEDHKQHVANYLKATEAKSDIERQETNREKTGVFTGAYAINPVNNEKIPVWIADYVLYGYGTGAIMAVPAHDERDYAFAQKFDLPIKEVVAVSESSDHQSTGEGLMIHSGKYDGMSSSDAREAIVRDLQEQGFATERTNYKLRDWLISRQRYWGAPIPIIHCPKDGAVAVPDDQLPVLLSEISSYEPSGDGRSPLANVPEFVNTTCPTCGEPAMRETDTMDGFACSSWYFLRFADPHNDQVPFERSKADFWLPVDDYIGGAEHAVMHLLYARFWTKVMFDDGLINFQEPFTTLRNHGMILAPDGAKMSKSKGNTIEPGELISQGYGADVIRIMELFIGPWNQAVSWSVESVGGAYRFLQRVWTLTQEYLEASPSDDSKSTEKAIQRITHKTIKKVDEDLQSLSFNTAIAALMECVNELYKLKEEDHFASHEAWKSAIESVIKLLAPFAPHITEELWYQLGNSTSIHTSPWPGYDASQLVSETMTIVVQINGKLRAQIEMAAETSEQEVIAAATAHEKVQAAISGKSIKKTVYVKGKLVNLVVS